MKEPATLMHSIRQRLLAHFEKSALFAPDDPAMEAAPADSGQLLFRFDMQAIAAAGYTLTTPVIVTNSSRFARIEPLLSGRVTAGQQLLRAKM